MKNEMTMVNEESLFKLNLGTDDYFGGTIEEFIHKLDEERNKKIRNRIKRLSNFIGEDLQEYLPYHLQKTIYSSENLLKEFYDEKDIEWLEFLHTLPGKNIDIYTPSDIYHSITSSSVKIFNTMREIGKQLGIDPYGNTLPENLKKKTLKKFHKNHRYYGCIQITIGGRNGLKLWWKVVKKYTIYVRGVKKYPPYVLVKFYGNRTSAHQLYYKK